jgi:hypothetical protein
MPLHRVSTATILNFFLDLSTEILVISNFEAQILAKYFQSKLKEFMTAHKTMDACTRFSKNIAITNSEIRVEDISASS